MKLPLFQNKKIFFLFLLLLLTFFLRFSSLTHTFLDIDEAQFAGFAHTLMDGGLPYADSLDTKPPLIYLYFLMGFFIFGKYSMVGLHFLHILTTFSIACILYKIGKENEDETTGLWAALLLTVFSTTYLPKFISISITSVMILPLSLSVLFWMKNKTVFYFLTGIMVAFAFLFKYQGGIQLGIFFAWSIFVFLKKEKTLKKTILDFLFLVFGFTTPLLLTGFLLVHFGIWDDFLQWSFQGSTHYIQSGFKTIPFFTNLLTKGGLFFLSTFLLWLSFFLYLKKKPLTGQNYKNLLVFWFLLSLLPVCIGGRFYGHYFIQLLPPLCLASASVLRQNVSKKFSRLALFFILVPSLVFFVPRINQNYTYRFAGDDELEKEEKIGNSLKNKPGKTLFVWGFATAIYFHSQKKPVSRFLWTDLQTGRIPGSDIGDQARFDTSAFSRKEAWEALLKDLEKTPPVYFVDTAPADIHKYKKYPIALYPTLFKFLMEKYEYFGTVENAVIYRLKD